MAQDSKSIHQFTAVDADGKEVPFDKYKGKALIVVNVASECGLANSNYTQLKDVLEKYKTEGLEVAAFPCNQFNNQEPGCEIDIRNSVREKYSFEPDLYSKVDVNGKNQHPIYEFLKKEQGGFMFDAIKWNFTKFLVDRQGHVVKRYGPNTDPKTIIPDIEAVLSKSA
ncbi:glutathione peroxidase domain-containing protein [Ditylenchus destructor]|uniref:Glutathione peroxidase n=1 Tax=Ditylenchus destructor TaxID=166010 RepID=A0AAD4R5X5_9BILA|nr:glutathione peroxidase domain-containing protein [Ditylenchus destructor]